MGKAIKIINPEIVYDNLFVPNDKTFARKGFKGLNAAGKLKFAGILFTSYIKLTIFHWKALFFKKAAVGPFWGEFGNFHLHYYPYVAYLHKQGVKLDLCVIDNFIPFLKDSHGNNLYENIIPLKNILGIIKSSGNELSKIGEEQSNDYHEFVQNAKARKKPLLDLSESNLYWYVFRNWQLRGRQHIYRLHTAKNDHKKPVVALFPRNISGSYSPNNGYAWDYMQLASEIAPNCERVIITGHPSMSTICKEEGNIEVKLSADNNDILQFISVCDIVLTQHSGAMHIANYFKIPVCIIFKGNLPVKGLDDSVRFRENLKEGELYFAQSASEVKTLLNSFIDGKFFLK